MAESRMLSALRGITLLVCGGHGAVWARRGLRASASGPFTFFRTRLFLWPIAQFHLPRNLRTPTRLHTAAIGVGFWTERSLLVWECLPRQPHSDHVLACEYADHQVGADKKPGIITKIERFPSTELRVRKRDCLWEPLKKCCQVRIWFSPQNFIGLASLPRRSLSTERARLWSNSEWAIVCCPIDITCLKFIRRSYTDLRSK